MKRKSQKIEQFNFYIMRIISISRSCFKVCTCERCLDELLTLAPLEDEVLPLHTTQIIISMLPLSCRKIAAATLHGSKPHELKKQQISIPGLKV